MIYRALAIPAGAPSARLELSYVEDLEKVSAECTWDLDANGYLSITEVL